MGRKSSTIEYLEKLVEWSGEKKEFCRLTGVRHSNLSAYLNGKKRVTWNWLEKNTQKVCGEPPAFMPVLEGYDLFAKNLPTVAILPKQPGLYVLYDSAMRALYFGKATSLYAEVRQTLKRNIAEVRPWTGNRNLKFRDISMYLSAFTINRGDQAFIHDVESFVLQILVNNTFNKKSGKFKRKA